jgi:MFS family permease
MVAGFIAGGQMLSFDNLLMEFGRPDNRPTYIAVSTLISGITSAAVPVFAGYVAENYTYTALFYVFATLMVTAAFFMNRKVTDPRDVEEYWS